MLKEDDLKSINLEQWVKDSKTLSLSHIRELVVSTIIMGNEYEKVINYLKDMSKNETSNDFSRNGEDKKKLGF